jgi:alpha-mannosidase
MTTVHIVLHAHLDPIWLWPWQAGVDEALATCRSACDRLDHNPDAIYTQGEAWVYHQVEEHDRALFRRIRRHVQAGRWALTGGWWIQPDCNAPGADGFRRQIACGKEYFLDRFGAFPDVAFNPDSFGHAATLPGFMAEAGQKHYIMMRPQEHELALPARLFRWRGYDEGPEVTTFRIAGSYVAQRLTEEHLRAACTALPEGVVHTMCFAGVGDHGGGPDEELISWIRAHREAFPGLRLEFSSPSRFFAAIASDSVALPLVTGELQHHAVGCYSVHRPIKLGVRLSEQALAQAERALALDPRPARTVARDLREHWRTVAFMQFHDTMGGTCLPSAYRQVDAQLGAVQAFADRVVQQSLRRQLTALPADPLQRLVFFNASETSFSDWVEVEPWMGRRGWPSQFSLIDEAGLEVPCQQLRPESIVSMSWPVRLLLKLEAGPGQMRVLRVAENRPRPALAAAVMRTLDGLQNGIVVADLCNGIRWNGRAYPLPQLQLLDDPTDTWSHGVSRFSGRPVDAARWEAPVASADGELMCETAQSGLIGASSVLRQLRLYAGEAFVELRHRVCWSERLRLLKLVLTLPTPPLSRCDGIPGGWLERSLDGNERPLRDAILLHFADGHFLGLVCPDIFAVDVTRSEVRLTLLRSPQMAHHVPDPGGRVGGRSSDRGEHDFRLRLVFGEALTAAALDAMAQAQQQPLAYADLTRGMPCCS